MSIVIAYAYPILLSVIFGYYNGWQWTDEQDGVYDPKKAKPKWKAASVAYRLLAVIGPFLPVELGHYIIGVAISLPVFDMVINLTRGVGLFYLGTTSKTDRLGRWKWYSYAVLIALAIVLNIFL